MPIVRNFLEASFDRFPLCSSSPQQYFLEEEEIFSESPSGLWWRQTYQWTVSLGHEQRVARLLIHIVNTSCFLLPGAAHEGHIVAFSLSHIICSHNRCDDQNQSPQTQIKPDCPMCLGPLLCSGGGPGVRGGQGTCLKLRGCGNKSIGCCSGNRKKRDIDMVGSQISRGICSLFIPLITKICAGAASSTQSQKQLLSPWPSPHSTC